MCVRESVIVSKKTVREHARAREEETELQSAHARTCICVRVCGDGDVCVRGGGCCVCRVGACGRGGDPLGALIVIEWSACHFHDF